MNYVPAAVATFSVGFFGHEEEGFIQSLVSLDMILN